LGFFDKVGDFKKAQGKPQDAAKGIGGKQAASPPEQDDLTDLGSAAQPEWYYTQKRQQVGPVTWTSLRELALSGKLLQTDMVWKPGMVSWAVAGSLTDLYGDWGRAIEQYMN
jgi:hypothetical protein